MFVSSYNTYIHTNPSEKTSKERLAEKKSDFSFTGKLLQQQNTDFEYTQNLPIDYISKSKAFSNKLTIQVQEQQLEHSEDASLQKPKELTKEYTTHKTLENAKKAYAESVQIFSFFKKPQIVYNQSANILKKLPADVQEFKDKNLRPVMVNTYLANDKYYQITA
jgi:hypothetical protein